MYGNFVEIHSYIIFSIETCTLFTVQLVLLTGTRFFTPTRPLPLSSLMVLTVCSSSDWNESALASLGCSCYFSNVFLLTESNQSFLGILRSCQSPYRQQHIQQSDHIFRSHTLSLYFHPNSRATFPSSSDSRKTVIYSHRYEHLLEERSQLWGLYMPFTLRRAGEAHHCNLA